MSTTNPFAAELEAALAEYGPTVTIPEAAKAVNVSTRTIRPNSANGDGSIPNACPT